mmetsp:Transcript_45852/g.141924  ORF Transcript_45852/g.141924 Transcript_45852/m.141924 type:complete len:269 (+) Transcript_45852:293-1099(+)
MLGSGSGEPVMQATKRRCRRGGVRLRERVWPEVGRAVAGARSLPAPPATGVTRPSAAGAPSATRSRPLLRRCLSNACERFSSMRHRCSCVSAVLMCVVCDGCASPKVATPSGCCNTTGVAEPSEEAAAAPAPAVCRGASSSAPSAARWRRRSRARRRLSAMRACCSRVSVDGAPGQPAPPGAEALLVGRGPSAGSAEQLPSKSSAMRRDRRSKAARRFSSMRACSSRVRAALVDRAGDGTARSSSASFCLGKNLSRGCCRGLPERSRS